MSVFRSLLMKRVGGGQEYEGYPLIIPSTTAGSLLTYEIYGKSLQLTTPTPSAPVDVWGTGEKTINIFDLSQAVMGDISSSTGQISYNTRRFASDYIPVAENDVIYFNGTVANTDGTTYNATIARAYYDSSQAFIAGSRAAATSGFTIPSGVAYVRMVGYNSSMTGNMDLSATKVNITKNVSVPATYLPYKAITVASGGDCGIVDLGTLYWAYRSDLGTGVFTTPLTGYDKQAGNTNLSLAGYTTVNRSGTGLNNLEVCGHGATSRIYVRNTDYSDAATFKDAMQGKYLYYQRTTDESWTAPTTTMIEIPDPLHKVVAADGTTTFADVLKSDGTITRNIMKVELIGTEAWSESGAYFQLTISGMAYGIDVRGECYCSHLPARTEESITHACVDFGGTNLRNRVYVYHNAEIPGVTDVTTWKAFLAAQYAAGTPVTIWVPRADADTESFTATNIPTQDVTTKITVGNAPGASNIKATY